MNGQFGFYDQKSKQFFVVPAANQQEFNQIMELIRNIGTTQNTIQNPGFEEKFDDFDSVVDEVMNTPFNEFSQRLL